MPVSGPDRVGRSCRTVRCLFYTLHPPYFARSRAFPLVVAYGQSTQGTVWLRARAGTVRFCHRPVGPRHKAFARPVRMAQGLAPVHMQLRTRELEL